MLSEDGDGHERVGGANCGGEFSEEFAEGSHSAGCVVWIEDFLVNETEGVGGQAECGRAEFDK